MNMNKLTSGLASRLSTVGSAEMLDVVLELESGEEPSELHLTPREKVAVLRERFSQSSAPIEDQIQQVGGEVLGSAWINRTIRARIPADGVSHLTELKSVERVDLPRALEPEKL
jgi:hypothetical protein